MANESTLQVNFAHNFWNHFKLFIGRLTLQYTSKASIISIFHKLTQLPLVLMKCQLKNSSQNVFPLWVWPYRYELLFKFKFGHKLSKITFKTDYHHLSKREEAYSPLSTMFCLAWPGAAQPTPAWLPSPRIWTEPEVVRNRALARQRQSQCLCKGWANPG